MKPPPRLSSLTMLVLLVLLLVPLRPSTAVHAGDDAPAPAPAPPPALRDAKRRHAELEHRLQVALVRADLNETRAEQLLRFVEDLLVRLADASKPDESAQRALREHVDRLQAETARLQDARRREQERFVKTIEELRQEAEEARALSAPLEAQVLRANHARDVAEEQLRYQKHEVERLRWVYANEAPRESVSRILSNIPAAHWRAELLAGDATRARVALQVLGVLPDRSAETIRAILHAAHTESSLLDAATGPLLRIGEPAVQPLVEAACGEGEAKPLDRGWVMHVLGQMGSAAGGALPWLEEVAEGKGREAEQARRALEKIRGT